MQAQLLALAIVLVTVARGASTAWLDEGDLPQAVAGQASAGREGMLWMVGGSRWEGAHKRIDGTVLRRLLGSAMWSQMGSIPGGFAHGGWACEGQALWLAGGLDAAGASRAVWRIDLAIGAVERVGSLGSARAYCGAAVLAGSLWVIGGTPVDGDFARTSASVWRIDLETRAIEELSAPGPALINPVVIPLRGELHVLPGSEWSTEGAHLRAPAESWIFSPAVGIWRQRSLKEALPRGLMGVALDENRALLAGGVDRRGAEAVLSAAVWIYDARDGSLAAQAALPAPRLAGAMARVGADILLLGGEDGPRKRAATIWRWRGAP